MLLLFAGAGVPDGMFVEVSGDNGATWLYAGYCVRQGDVNFEGYRPELDESRPGEMTLTVSNQTRDWDPDYASSPLAGANDVGCRIRLTLRQGGVSYQLFLGTIDRLEQDPHIGGHDMTATVVALDDNALMANGRLRSGYEQAIRTASGGSGLYLALDEPADTNYVSNPLSPSTFAGLWAGTARQNVDIMPSAPGGQRCGVQQSVLVLPSFASEGGTGKWHMSFMARFPILTINYESHNILTPTTGADGTCFLAIGIDPAHGGYATLALTQDYGAGNAVRDCYMVNDGAPHHWTIEGTPGTGISIWVDGVLTAAGPNTFNPNLCVALSTDNHFLMGSHDFSTPPYLEAEIGHFAQFAGAPAAGPTLALAAYTGSVGGGVWDTPDQRITWLLARAGITAGTIQTSTRLLRGVRGGESPAKHARLVAASDQGRFWVDADGLGQYRSGGGGSVAMSLRDDDSTKGFSGIRPTRDRSRRVTSARAIGQSGELVARYDSGASPAREVEIEVLNLLQSDAYTNVVALVAERDDVGTVYPEVTIVPADSDRWATVLGLEFGQYVRIVRTPVGVGSAVNVAAPIEGIRHSFGASTATFRTGLSLGVPTPSNFFILGTSQLGHERLA